MVPVSGAAEIAPHLGIADVIVDLTSTGSTLKMNGLREVATVLESSARLIARQGHAAEAAGAAGELAQALGSVLRGPGQALPDGQRAARACWTRCARCSPGLNGPTVVDVHGGGDFVAVHAVVARHDIYRTIAA